VGAVPPSRNATPACGRIAAEDTLAKPAGVVCVSPHVEYRGISAVIDEADFMTLDLIEPSPAHATPDETRELDVCFFIGCGLVCLSLGGLGLNAGRKRHRAGAKKSALRLRMMA
jgi:hypothetical protein